MKNLLFLLLGLLSTSIRLQGQTSREMLYVNSEKGDCQSTMTMKCLQIRNAGSKDWQNFPDEIEGFAYREGYIYTLEVEKMNSTDPLSGLTSSKYNMVKMVGKLVPRITLEIADKRVPCKDSASKKCLSVKEPGEIEWKTIGTQIEGFTYVPGYTYRVLVEKKLVSKKEDRKLYKYRYKKTFSNVQSLTAVTKKKINKKKYVLIGYNVKDSMQSIKETKAFIELNIDEKAFAGNDGCNSFFGPLDVISNNTIKFGMMAGTLMACPDKKEPGVTLTPLLKKVNHFVIEGFKLRLLRGNKLLLEYELLKQPR